MNKEALEKKMAVLEAELTKLKEDYSKFKKETNRELDFLYSVYPYKIREDENDWK